MTKTTYITKLNEIKGIKVNCKNCGANWFIPSAANNLPEECIFCKVEIPGKEIWKLTNKINELTTLSKNGEFEIVFETEVEQ